MKILHQEEPETVQEHFAGTASDQKKIKDDTVKESLLDDHEQTTKPKTEEV